MAPRKAAATTKRPAKAQKRKTKAAAETTTAVAKRPAKTPRAAATKEKKRLTAREVALKVNTEYKSTVIRLAGETTSSYLLRRPTGIISLDIALNGGFPASAPVVLCGPDGAGKDYILWRTWAEAQRIYGENFAAAVYLTEFKADKLFMKDICGLQIALTDEELAELDAARTNIGLPALTEEERAHYKHQVGEIMIIQGEIADVAFDILAKCLESNAFQFIAVNSIGFLQTEAKEDVDSFADFAQQSNEAALLNKVLPKYAMLLNRIDNEGESNETTIVFVNQMRARRDQVRKRPGIPTQEKDKYEPGSKAWALKHGKAIELTLHKGKAHFEESSKERLGREVPWEITKGKLGTHEGIRGTFDFFYDLGADVTGDLINTALNLEVLVQGGSWISYDHPEIGFKAQGRMEAKKIVYESRELQDALRRDCLTAAKVVYRHQ